METLTLLYLDWDVSFRYWSSHTRDRATGKRSVGWMKNRLRLIVPKTVIRFAGLPVPRVYVSYRRSGSGRVHIALEYPASVVFLPTEFTMWTVRTLLLDDPARVYLDIVRWCRGEPTNRLFDVKYSKGKIRRAGPWVRWFVLRGPSSSHPGASSVRRGRRRSSG